MTFLLLKMMHTFAAALSLSGFVLRGYWMLRDSSLLERRFTRIAPHIVDTLFLLTGLVLALMIGSGTLSAPWMIAKLLGLVAYIGLGTIALKRGRSKALRALAFGSAIVVFIYIVGAAVAKSPSSWLLLLQG